MGITGSLFIAQGYNVVTHHVKAAASYGVEIQNNTGGVVGVFGAGGSLGSTFYGQVNATSFAGSGSGLVGVVASNGFPFTGSGVLSGSIIITGSAQGNVVAVTVASNTASIDMNAGNFFTVTLANSATTHFNVTNLNPGENANIFVTTGTISSASFSTNIKQPSGSAYLPSSGSGVIDVLSLVALNSTNAYIVNAKRFI